MADYDLLDVFDFVAGCGDGGAQLVFGFVLDATEDVGDDGAPDLGIVFAAAGFPEDEAFVRVVD